MWKEKRGDKWRFKERYRDPLTGKLKYVSVTMETGSRQSIKEASAVLNHKIDEIMARYSSEGILDEVLLGRLIDEYLAYYKNRVRSSTYYSHVTTLKNFEKEIGSDALIANITPELITEFIESLLYRPDPISNSYASRYKNHIGQLFKFAKKKNYLLNNPVEKVELTYRNDEIKSSTANKFLEEEELQSFLEEAYSRNETYAQLCEWLYQTGTRFGESASLSFDDVYKKRW
ncbi:tyrosine-type recombinase/integrase [Limosilactobacillus equigenerosi]|uniref:tyrosine-type recombinase/integrase n=1 Tax=Limosilactobacillus equigenerosi TaxID=417373 RepID=UPI0006D0C899|nr:phage integrase SAM-like domain-containing protein [Limosilactobacillus equigenerosi]